MKGRERYVLAALLAGGGLYLLYRTLRARGVTPDPGAKGWACVEAKDGVAVAGTHCGGDFTVVEPYVWSDPIVGWLTGDEPYQTWFQDDKIDL